MLCVYCVCWHVCQPPLLHHAALRLLLWYVQVGEGSIAALSTGGAVSKFGFPLQVRLMPSSARTPPAAAHAQHSHMHFLHCTTKTACTACRPQN